jgi:salicylate hydroxylase
VKVKSVDVENTTLVLGGGEMIAVDLIIAADGVHSVIRPSIVDSSRFFPYQATGHVCFRFMVPKSTLKEGEIMSSLVDDNTHMSTYKGNDKRILLYPVDFDLQCHLYSSNDFTQSRGS